MKYDDSNSEYADRHAQFLISFAIHKRQGQAGVKNFAFGKHNCAPVHEFRL